MPAGKRVSQNYYPKEIVTGQHIDFKNHCRGVCGWYVEAQYDPNITNNMTPRTHECIALLPNRNIQGTQKVFCMNSGIFLKRINITPMIASDQIIKIVKYWGKKSRREKYGKAIYILNSNKEPFD